VVTINIQDIFPFE